MDITPLTEPADEIACADLMAASDPWRTLGYEHAGLLRTVRLPGRERYVARVDGVFAGFLLLNLQGTFAGYIQTVGLAPAFRGRGLGEQLLAFAEQRILRDHPNVFLCVSSFNQAARRFYARLGYEQVGELTDFLVAGHSEFLLRKTVGPIRGYRP
ncbi:MAG: GNAT family N-acetyltransferase [Rhodoferax sp.]|jgi:ribosomal-protein-alanine N-acetyltransferase|nr:GNAT family N-acetyltransferase [Rhodoferax sp.]